MTVPGGKLYTKNKQAVRGEFEIGNNLLNSLDSNLLDPQFMKANQTQKAENDLSKSKDVASVEIAEDQIDSILNNRDEEISHDHTET